MDNNDLIAGEYLSRDREIDHETWLHDVFPEWGMFLNREIETRVVPAGTVSLWWCGGPSWVLKTDAGGVFFIDMFAGPSHYTERGGVRSNWIRLNQHVIDPWRFSALDGVFCTHAHHDHCDLYTVKAALSTTNAVFYAPPVAAQKLRAFRVPPSRLVTTKVGGTAAIHGAEVAFLPCYDDVAAANDDAPVPFDDAAASFLFQTSAGNILFLGDTWYHDEYRALADHRVDVAIFAIGCNPVGATDKMTPYDGARLGEALGARLLVPDHWDNWSASTGDGALAVNQFERIVRENTPSIKTLIMRTGGRFDYPAMQSGGRYRY
jgi:L-ascorbate 6-phosphate lactonase